MGLLDPKSPHKALPLSHVVGESLRGGLLSCSIIMLQASTTTEGSLGSSQLPDNDASYIVCRAKD